MGNNKKKSKAASNGHRPRHGSRSNTPTLKRPANGNGRVGSDALARPVERSTPDSPSQSLRTYEIPDYRLERPTFTVTQRTERDKQGSEHVRYEVTGDLDAPVPRIRDSKYL